MRQVPARYRATAPPPAVADSSAARAEGDGADVLVRMPGDGNCMFHALAYPDGCHRRVRAAETERRRLSRQRLARENVIPELYIWSHWIT